MAKVIFIFVFSLEVFACQYNNPVNYQSLSYVVAPDVYRYENIARNIPPYYRNLNTYIKSFYSPATSSLKYFKPRYKRENGVPQITNNALQQPQYNNNAMQQSSLTKRFLLRSNGATINVPDNNKGLYVENGNPYNPLRHITDDTTYGYEHPVDEHEHVLGSYQNTYPNQYYPMAHGPPYNKFNCLNGHGAYMNTGYPNSPCPFDNTYNSMHNSYRNFNSMPYNTYGINIRHPSNTYDSNHENFYDLTYSISQLQSMLSSLSAHPYNTINRRQIDTLLGDSYLNSINNMYMNPHNTFIHPQEKYDTRSYNTPVSYPNNYFNSPVSQQSQYPHVPYNTFDTHRYNHKDDTIFLDRHNDNVMKDTEDEQTIVDNEDHDEDERDEDGRKRSPTDKIII